MVCDGHGANKLGGSKCEGVNPGAKNGGQDVLGVGHLWGQAGGTGCMGAQWPTPWVSFNGLPPVHVAIPWASSSTEPRDALPSRTHTLPELPQGYFYLPYAYLLGSPSYVHGDM